MKIQPSVPSNLIHELLETDCIESNISLDELLRNESFHANYRTAITHLAACQYEIIEQGIYQADAGNLYRELKTPGIE